MEALAANQKRKKQRNKPKKTKNKKTLGHLHKAQRTHFNVLDVQRKPAKAKRIAHTRTSQRVNGLSQGHGICRQTQHNVHTTIKK